MAAQTKKERQGALRAKRAPGRPEVQPEDRLQVVSIRLTGAQKAKLERLGGSAWLRKKIDKAKEDQRG